MHPLMLKAIVGGCRARVAEGDCPTTKAFSREQLEEAIVELAAGYQFAVAPDAPTRQQKHAAFDEYGEHKDRP